ncbi:MAG: peptide chain release factor N(5)-glutamine methyltransferase [bacterium]
MSKQPTENQSLSLHDLLTLATDFLKRKGIESPRLDAELLLAHVLGCDRMGLYLNFEKVLAEEEKIAFRELLRRRAERTPVAYLTGKKEFFGLAFEVTPEVLIPRPETELIVERGVELLRKQIEETKEQNPFIIDVGTGSGCVGVALAVFVGRVRVVATDLSPAALTVARRNAAHHNVAERMTFVEGDLFANYSGPPADLIVSNPPYVAEKDAATLAPEIAQHEPSGALFAGPQGFEIIERLLDEAPRHLKPNGTLLFEFGAGQQPDIEGLLMARTGSFEAPRFHRDLAGHPRACELRRSSR